MNSKFLITLTLAAGVAFATACSKSKAPAHDDHADSGPHEDEHAEPHAGEKPGEHAGESGPEPGHGEEQAVPLAGLRGIRFEPVPEPKPEGAWYAAEAIGDEGAQSILTSAVAGIVDGPPAAPGRPMKTGQRLLTVRSPELADLHARWRIADAKRQRAAIDLARERRLTDGGAGSARDLEIAQSEQAMAQAEEEAARIALQARGATPGRASALWLLTAPGAGSVVEWTIQAGQGVAAGERLGRFQTGAAALARLDLAASDSTGLALGTESEARSADGRKWRARVEGVPQQLSSETRRQSYRLRLSGGALPLPGTPLEVKVPLATGMHLPQTALQQVQGVWGVFVKQGDVARFRPVRRGAELGTHVMVVSGVTPGEEVVAEGAYLVKSLYLRQQGEEAGHEH